MNPDDIIELAHFISTHGTEPHYHDLDDPGSIFICGSETFGFGARALPDPPLGRDHYHISFEDVKAMADLIATDNPYEDPNEPSTD